MDRMLYTAMSGAKHTMDQQSVISQNLSNVSTAGFRAQLQAARSVPVMGDGALATRVSAVTTTPGTDFSQGPIERTGRSLDVAMQDSAWMAVLADDGSETYTRRGDLQLDNDGVLLSVGRPVMGDGGPIALPQGAQISIGADGTISAIPQGEGPEALVDVGRIKLVTPDEQGLTRGDDGLFRAPVDEEGAPGVLPADDEARIVSGALEGSNVSAVDAMVSMIDVARRYDMQMKILSTADENAQRANSILSIQG
ncbi:flagellar basal body rod protein FlgF [Halomonas sp. GFAJ-1]|uniref:flagellar basal body rod protein FlgF n=1 Tax=Halomonas sp. GFAJ-1 TaxID=1118153 RepID=UPI00023A4B78|nr:flagellar basal body rod protein FlgF [Halomonas sp. GFAJ-1]AVI61823.1 flagellar biosynthesis protein FlgF [Halomonas sp. GFAJ-1]EHK61478.1 flagellar basal body rod protein FlgF [Halomonas sp. GFAJ-1]